MTKKLQSVETYHFGFYIVVLEGLKNDNNGNRRFKATIIYCNATNSMSAVYTFTGHCMTEREEAEWILQLHLDESQN